MARRLPDCTLEQYPHGELPGQYPTPGLEVPGLQRALIKRVLSIVNYWADEWRRWGCGLAMRVIGLSAAVRELEERVAKLEKSGGSPTAPGRGSGPVIGETTQPPPPPFKGGGRL
jgi:hypothetical protein